MRRRTVLASGAVAMPTAAAALSPPGPQPESLLQKLERRTQYVLAGVPRSFWFVPAEATRDFIERRSRDANYRQLVDRGASDAEVRTYQESLPVDRDGLRLRPESEVRGLANAFLEFDWMALLFRRDQPSFEMGSGPGANLYFELGASFQGLAVYRQAWTAPLGRRVILLARGLQPAVSRAASRLGFIAPEGRR